MTAIGDATSVRDFQIGRARRPRSLRDDSLPTRVVLTGQERFKIECFYVIMDTLVADLTRRTNAAAELNHGDSAC